ncbi:hypothetical protein SeMB42_g07986 [Synchytrium endobioticum]|uniref:Aprataxin C2HE/C2H2/C2HC zinc finger domain-containing protein n=1 Tax=Synchytrium endobioticum TaxID=286115 RepID=A0A507BXR1_9FUNG|nr:hypothetical protein SeMB42_g07986 [Synchytrium endobioticum]
MSPRWGGGGWMYLVPSRQPYILKYGGARVKAVSQTAKQYNLPAVEIGELETRAYSHALVVCQTLVPINPIVESMSSPAKSSPPGYEARTRATATCGSGGKWADALLQYVKTPEMFPKVVYEFDDDVVIIYDQYPKAKYHFLVMPRIQIDGPNSLIACHIPFVEKIKQKALKLTSIIQSESSDHIEFRMGFHAVPSMKQLHLHVISTDFKSERLKHRKHWVSFTSGFFKDVDEVLAILRKDGRVYFDKEEYEDIIKTAPLRCHKCHKDQKTMPALKRHLEDWH